VADGDEAAGASSTGKPRGAAKAKD
jgi:hypothetical protein